VTSLPYANLTSNYTNALRSRKAWHVTPTGGLFCTAQQLGLYEGCRADGYQS
jgi:hypothetical protein